MLLLEKSCVVVAVDVENDAAGRKKKDADKTGAVDDVAVVDVAVPLLAVIVVLE